MLFVLLSDFVYYAINALLLKPKLPWLCTKQFYHLLLEVCNSFFAIILVAG